MAAANSLSRRSKPPLKDLPLEQLNLRHLTNPSLPFDDAIARWHLQRAHWRAAIGSAAPSRERGTGTPLQEVVLEGWSSSSEEEDEDGTGGTDHGQEIAEWTVTTDEDDSFAAKLKKHGVSGRKRLTQDHWRPAATPHDPGSAKGHLYFAALAFCAAQYVGAEALLVLRATCKAAAIAAGQLRSGCLTKQKGTLPLPFPSLLAAASPSLAAVPPVGPNLLFCPSIRVLLPQGRDGTASSERRKRDTGRVVVDLRFSSPSTAAPFDGFGVLSVAMLLRRRIMVASGLPLLASSTGDKRRFYRPWDDLDDCVLTRLSCVPPSDLASAVSTTTETRGEGNQAWRYRWFETKGPCFVKDTGAIHGLSEENLVLPLAHRCGNTVAVPERAVLAKRGNAALPKAIAEARGFFSRHRPSARILSTSEISSSADNGRGSFFWLLSADTAGGASPPDYRCFISLFSPTAADVKPARIPLPFSLPSGDESGASSMPAAVMRGDHGILVLSIPSPSALELGQLAIVDVHALKRRLGLVATNGEPSSGEDQEDLIVKMFPSPLAPSIVTTIELGPSLIVAGYSSGHVVMICRRTLELIHVLPVAPAGHAAAEGPLERNLGHHCKARRYANSLRVKIIDDERRHAVSGKEKAMKGESRLELTSYQQALCAKLQLRDATSSPLSSSSIVALALHENLPGMGAADEATSLVAWLRSDGTGVSLQLTVKRRPLDGGYVFCSPCDCTCSCANAGGGLASLLLGC